MALIINTSANFATSIRLLVTFYSYFKLLLRSYNFISYAFRCVGFIYSLSAIQHRNIIR